MIETIKSNLNTIHQNIEAHCQAVGRDPSKIKILLASKTVSTGILRQVFDSGYFLFGENKAQELKEKHKQLIDLAIDWHFIGHLQSNKAKEVAPLCSLIHSLDRLSLAHELEKIAQRSQRTLRVLVEVNTSGEDSKSGIALNKAIDFCKQIQDLKHIEIKGLMTMATNTDNQQKIRDEFKRLKELSLCINELKLPHFSMDELSMGMSQDYGIAIEEGATLVRLGTAVFGSRV